jgi:hypothetical protein
MDRYPIVLRDKNKPAHSETFVVADFRWAEQTNEWPLLFFDVTTVVENVR